MRLLVYGSLVWVLAAGGQAGRLDAELTAARVARDRGNASAIRKELARFKQDDSLAGQLRIALLNDWLCETLYGVNDSKGVKQAALDGLAAAERAVRLDGNSSEAHRLLAQMLGQLIPHVFAGGMRYGPRSSKEIERALQLDPNNVEAHITRASSSLFTPEAFGGSKPKALADLERALELDPLSDTAHLWKAQVYVAMKQPAKALTELQEALRINPERAYTKYLLKETGGGR